MKVLQILPALEQGGVETVVCALNRVVAGLGWQSVVVSCGGRLAAQIVADGGRHVRLDVRSKNPLTAVSRILRLRRLVRAEKPDLVCVHSRVPAWLYVGVRRVDSLLRRFGRPSVSPRWLTYAHGANSVSRYSSVMTRGDLTVVPSRFLADFLKRHYGLADGRLRVIPPAVDEARFDPARLDAAFVAAKRRAWGLDDDSFVVMAVGRLTPLKGYDALLRTAAALAPRVPKLKVVIVGDADARHREHLASLRALTRELGLEASVVFAGGETKIPECLSLATVVVSSNTAKPESFGLSMAEALMMGKPVVAKAFGGALDIVRDGVDGRLVRDGDFAAALEALWKNPLHPDRADAVRRFGMDGFAAATERLYREDARARPEPSERKEGTQS